MKQLDTDTKFKLEETLYIMLGNYIMVQDRTRTTVEISREISRCHLESRCNRLAPNI